MARKLSLTTMSFIMRSLTFDALKQTTSITAILISGIALIGWWTNHAALAAWLPGIANMTFNTALCFMLIALACLQAATGGGVSQMLKAGAGLFIALFAASSLLQDALALNLGIDNLLFDSHGYGLASPHPGRMSPVTSTGFLLAGMALFSMATKRESKHILAITQAMILLVAMVAISGIGMNMLARDVAEAYAHLTSISLFTAISFLLLAIALMGIFKQRHRLTGADTLLYSGIHLMYRLSYPQKFVLVSMIFLMPLTAFMWNEISRAEQDAIDSGMKIAGIRHIHLTARLSRAIAEHRGMAQARFTDPNMFRTAITEKSAKIGQLFTDNQGMDQEHARLYSTAYDWPGTESRWLAIKKNHINRLRQWRMHTEIIAKLNERLRDIALASSLSLDRSPVLHNLLGLISEVMPGLFEQIGQLRGLGVDFMIRGGISRGEQLKLKAITSRIGLRLHELQLLFRLPQLTRRLQGVNPLYNAFTDQVRTFISTADAQLIASKTFSIPAGAYFSQGTAAIGDGYAFNDAILTYVEEQLQQRIIKRTTTQYSINFATVLLLLLLLYLFASFYRSVMNSVQSLDAAARRVSKGEANALALLPGDDELGNIVGSFKTIAEELVRVSSHMSAVVDHAADGIITINADGAIKSFNPAAEHIFGYSSDEVIGRDIVTLMPERYHASHKAGLQHYHQAGETSVVGAIKPVEVQGLKKDSSQFPMELSINAMSIDGQQMFISMVRDISERQNIESQLRHAQKMEAIGALVGGVAHNFNNLLAGIVGKAYMAKRKIKDRPEEALSNLESIEQISAQAGEMVQQLLTYAHKDFFSNKQNARLAVLIREGFNTARLGIAEDIELSLNIAVADMMVFCDTNQIQQVLMNMMNNARDALTESVEKRISIHLDRCRPDAEFLQRHSELSPGQYACLTISDSGCGMDAETMARIFEPFYSTKEVGAGTGLGLSSTFGSITSHGGVIEVESEPGSGTAFRVYLPCIATTEIDADDSDHQMAVRSMGRETLLLVDDEPLIRHAMQEVLEELGYEVFTAMNGAQGLECFRQHQDRIAAVITDVVMPKMGGVKMFREIRQINGTLPAIFITGYDQDNVQLQSDEMKYTYIISKPVKIPELSKLVQKIIIKHRQNA